MHRKLIAAIPFLTFCCLLLAGMVTSCSHFSKGKTMTTDSLKYDSTTTVGKNKITCKMVIDYPLKGNAALLSSVREWINENMENEYTGNLSDGKKMVTSAGKALVDTLAARAKGYGETNMEVEYMRQISMRKIYETKTLVTYEFDSYSYDGGAHGGEILQGATFRKSDGRKLGWDMFSQYKISDLQELIKQGLKGYFKVQRDEELKDNFLNPEQIYYIPLPQAEPYFTKDGLQFVYQQYEIACYAAGMPKFTVPYDKVKKMFTLAASGLLK